MNNALDKRITLGLYVLLALCIGRLWLMPLGSSFWVDEMGTAFVVHYGGNHPSFAVAPQVPASIYYILPKLSERLFGFSEIAYRVPSVLLMGVTLFLVGRLAARLIHPQAAWFAVFACLALRDINYEAANARPYALGACVSAAALLFLVRWLDTGSWLHAAAYIVLGALLWRVHLIFWPFYVLFALYAVLRLWRRDTRVTWIAALAVFAVLGAALIPVLLSSLALMRNAKNHVVVPLPTLREFIRLIKLGQLASCGAIAWLVSRAFRWTPDVPNPSWSSLALLAGYWLCDPLCIFAFSWITGDSVFVPRYLAFALPGMALAATVIAARFVASAVWRPLALVFGVGVLLVMGHWTEVWPLHHNSDWRRAAQTVNRLEAMGQIPVICPSPFIEARSPVWRPDYPLPGFLYSHLAVYRLNAPVYLFPFKESPEAYAYADELSKTTLEREGRFLVYGGQGNVRFWRKWFQKQPEFAGWQEQRLGPFADVDVVLFRR
ncbi:MAG TPA: glycosyltransferase family 39 protein [Bryobacteraceae bacterium]|nr:glycosyltransferase family 39 protein [Bryobacteraceae bacterium]